MLSCHKTIYVCPNFIARGVSAYFFGGMNGVVVLTPRNQAATAAAWYVHLDYSAAALPYALF